MIITRTPLRISIGGGGTDLPSYYSRFGGFVIAATIDKYVYITLHQTFKKEFLIKYSQMETVDSADKIRHPIIREAFKMHQVEPMVEMVSMADLPAGTGLGSSGAFSVGLLRAIYSWKRQPATPQLIAEEACHIEMDLLKQPIGKQDQYISSFGGFTCLTIDPSGKTDVTPLKMAADTIHDLEDNLLMFFTGFSRNAGDVLEDQKMRTDKEDPAMIENLHFIKEIGLSIKTALEAGRAEEFAALMHQHWLHKKKRSSGISNDQINGWYDIGFANGALGGKLIGAGGGGFLLFYAHDRKKLRQAMARAGLPEVRFHFDYEGSRILVRD
jgi:D-glycero-alpha-D-manno-heptose-7-phosphate kinase